MNISKAELISQMLDEELVEQKEPGGNLSLTRRGETMGGEVRKGRYGSYIAWEPNMKIPKKQKEGEEAGNNPPIPNKEYKTVTATIIGKEIGKTARQTNLILSELGFVYRENGGWRVTPFGKQEGGEQRTNPGNNIPFVIWDKKILSSPWLREANISGGEKKETPPLPDSNTKEGFRGKYEATHRTTDGHMVRSKAEMIIDNWLYMEGIVHAYERKVPVEEELYCDFYLPDGRIYVEFWGMESSEKYANRQDSKRKIYMISCQGSC